MDAGFHPTSKGSRLRRSVRKAIIPDGPFTEAKKAVAGFWIIQNSSKEEAIE
jgi:hypothetical protein